MEHYDNTEIVCPDCNHSMNLITYDDVSLVGCPECNILLTDMELLNGQMSPMTSDLDAIQHLNPELPNAGTEDYPSQMIENCVAHSTPADEFPGNQNEDVQATSRTILDLVENGEFFCSVCGGNEWEALDGEDITVFACLSCDDMFGIQDTMNAKDLERLIEEGLVRTQLAISCHCGNNDAFKFRISGDSVLECLHCGSIISMMDNPEMSSDPETAHGLEGCQEQPLDLKLVCDYCPNTENDMFEKFNSKSGRLYSIVCKLCDRRTDLPALPIECSRCHNIDQEFNKTFDDELEGWYVECNRCSRVFFHPLGFEPQLDIQQDGRAAAAVGRHDGASDDHLRSSEDGQCQQKWNRQRVTSIDEVRVGDHVSFRRSIYWHHAIVVGIKPRASQPLSVIHYSGDVVKLEGNFASVRREDLAVNLDKNEMYVHVYENGSEYSPEEVISRAESRLGEHQYNPFAKNCEHFASWCKLGVDVCIQVKEATVRASQVVGGSFVIKLPSEIASASGAVRALEGGFKNGVRAAKKRFVGSLKKGNVKTKALIGTLALNLVTEGAVLGYCAWSAYKQYKDTRISWADYKKELVKVSGECSGGFVGGSAGGIIGQILLPVPLIGGFVGMTLGSAFGRLVGGSVGGSIGEKIYKKEI